MMESAVTEKKSNKDLWIKIVSWDLGYFISAMTLMFALALVHKDVHGVPAVGYWASFGVVWATNIVGIFFRGIPKDTK